MISSLRTCLCPTLVTANSTKTVAPLGSADRIPSLTFHGWTLILRTLTLRVFSNLNDSVILLTLACSELYLGTSNKNTVLY